MFSSYLQELKAEKKGKERMAKTLVATGTSNDLVGEEQMLVVEKIPQTKKQ